MPYNAQHKEEVKRAIGFLRGEVADAPKTLAKHNEIQNAFSSLESFTLKAIDDLLLFEAQARAQQEDAKLPNNVPDVLDMPAPTPRN